MTDTEATKTEAPAAKTDTELVEALSTLVQQRDKISDADIEEDDKTVAEKIDAIKEASKRYKRDELSRQIGEIAKQLARMDEPAEPTTRRNGTKRKHDLAETLDGLNAIGGTGHKGDIAKHLGLSGQPAHSAIGRALAELAAAKKVEVVPREDGKRQGAYITYKAL